MKRKLISLLLCLTMAVAFAAPTFAASYEDTAETLKSVGLFRGTDKGFELDRPATRIEAAVMLVRLLGLEDAAMTRFAAKETAHPFTDVPEWADAYVALLYTDGIAKGSGETVFGVSDCTAQMYCTFLLRALGYTEAAGDFTYDRATEKATALGFYDGTYFEGLFGNGSFLRDDVVAVSYLALAANVKNTEKTLLAKLCDDGAVNAAAAEKLLTLQKELREFNQLTASVKTGDLSAMDMDMKLNLAFAGVEDLPVGAVTGDVKALLNLKKDDIRASISYLLAMGEQKMDMQIWFKDGWLYAQVDGEKIKAPYDLSELLSLTKEADAEQTAADAALLTLFIKELTKNADGSYELSVSDAILAPLYDVVNLFAQTSGGELAFDLQIGNIAYRFDKNGAPKEIAFEMSLFLAEEDASMKADVAISADLYTGGKTVKITFPSDLSSFQETELGF